jgi:hypothetical protein
MKNPMQSRNEQIEGFHHKVSGAEKEIYEEFERNQEKAMVDLMEKHFARADRKNASIGFDNHAMWAEIETNVDNWFEKRCAYSKIDMGSVMLAKDAIRHKLRDHLIKAIRVFLARRKDQH